MSNAVTHTQGSWDITHIWRNPLSTDVLYIINKGNPQSIKEAEANAKLIAAAPELLKALRDLKFLFQSDIDFTPATKEQILIRLNEIVKPAINKATL
jgi:hypothetical protein